VQAVFRGFTGDFLVVDLDAVDQVYKNEGIYSNPRYDSNRLGANIGYLAYGRKGTWLPF